MDSSGLLRQRSMKRFIDRLEPHRASERYEIASLRWSLASYFSVGENLYLGPFLKKPLESSRIDSEFRMRRG
jgi:hypothetical protein